MDLALNNLQWLICHKNQPTTKFGMYTYRNPGNGFNAKIFSLLIGKGVTMLTETSNKIAINNK